MYLFVKQTCLYLIIDDHREESEEPLNAGSTDIQVSLVPDEQRGNTSSEPTSLNSKLFIDGWKESLRNV